MKLISQCPACKGPLQIRTLQCPDCGMELKNNFEFSPFDALDDEETAFLVCFLKCQGNLSQLQEEMKQAAADLQFERAAQLRDLIFEYKVRLK